MVILIFSFAQTRLTFLVIMFPSHRFFSKDERYLTTTQICNVSFYVVIAHDGDSVFYKGYIFCKFIRVLVPFRLLQCLLHKIQTINIFSSLFFHRQDFAPSTRDVDVNKDVGFKTINEIFYQFRSDCILLSVGISTKFFSFISSLEAFRYILCRVFSRQFFLYDE